MKIGLAEQLGMPGGRSRAGDQSVQAQLDSNAFLAAATYKGSADQMMRELSGEGYVPDPNWKPIDKNSPNYFSDLATKMALVGNSYWADQSKAMQIKQMDAAMAPPPENKMLTSDLKEYAMVTGDNNIENKAAAREWLEHANRSRSTKINMPEYKMPATMIGMDIAKMTVDKETNQMVNPTMSPEQYTAGINSGRYAMIDQKQREDLQTLDMADKNVSAMNALYLEATRDMPDGDGIIGMYNRVKYATKGAMQDDNGAMKAYKDSLAAVTASLSKALGNSGAMSDEDVARSSLLLSQINALDPLNIDSRRTAIRKMNQLNAIIQVAKRAKGGKITSSRYVEAEDPSTGEMKTYRYYTGDDGIEKLDEDFMR